MMPTRAEAWTAETIEWQETAPDGSKYALLEGRRDVGGEPFTYAFFIPAGFWDPAHWHTQDARVFVVSGALHLGYGDELKPNQAKAHPAGSLLLLPAEARHFDGSDVDTLIVGTAVGKWATYYVNPDHTSSAGTPVL